MHALDHLTEDCWKEILKRVKDPKDLWSCSEACLTFQEILRKKRNLFMFDLILPIIKKYLPAHNRYPNNELAQWIAPLKCRLVCKSWCQTVDKLRDAEDKRTFEDLYWFCSGQKTERFLQHFSTHVGNPFLGRSVALLHRSPLLLAGNQPEALNAYGVRESFHIRKLREFLERFGKEIWTVKMHELTEVGGEVEDQNLSLCKNLQTVLGHLPNLRALIAQASFFGNEGLVGGNMADTELTSYIAANPLPDLPKLEHVEISGFKVGMKRFILEKYAPNLKSVFADDPLGFPEQALEMCSLKELVFDDLDASTSLRYLRQLQAPQLRDLKLNLSGNRHSVELWPMDELFRNIQHLPIQSLKISAEDAEVFLGESGPITPEQRPYHRSISSVDLIIPGGTASFNFLLYCPQLTRIVLLHDSPDWEIPHEHSKAVPELLDFRGMLEQVGSDLDLYQSNIWEHLPLLEDLTIAVASDWIIQWRSGLRRGEYEKRKKQPEK